ncbi:glycosyltransferase [Dichotomicrobium thermohalophilum]|uniref:Glycosyltransferase involved in cell wall biosynthesis n=1 Tax=Dichotomicrobium thermohalophilum TaxID=933063 RepID=A0A397Q461_9HYPH|nr:glycosyltransferase [Dichotomicrobium thermohalophilum]RIA55922.1 glycosyltransferase involved in cell wall biosynthesis [Dichotomicrobium thermohalophilum]
MKILNVIGSNKKGGAEQFFVRHAQALQERGVSQSVVVRKGGWVEKRLGDSGIPLVSFPFGGALDFVTKRKMERLIKAEKPDVILSWMGRAAKHVPETEAPHITRLGNYYPLKHYKNCDYFIGNTPEITKYILDQGVEDGRVRYIPNFVQTKPAKPADRSIFNTPPDAPLILWMGRMTHSKGPDVVVEALSDVPGAYLWMAGAGEMQDALEAAVRQRQLESRVRFLGWREDIFSLLKAADVFVCASRHEALGNVILEAWAQSTPVVAARSPGPEHLIEDGRTGILFENGSPQSLAESLNQLIESPHERRRMGAEGNRYLSENFGREKIVDQYIDLFENARRSNGA